MNEGSDRRLYMIHELFINSYLLTLVRDPVCYTTPVLGQILKSQVLRTIISYQTVSKYVIPTPHIKNVKTLLPWFSYQNEGTKLVVALGRHVIQILSGGEKFTKGVV